MNAPLNVQWYHSVLPAANYKIMISFHLGLFPLYTSESFQVQIFKLNEWYIIHSTYGHIFWDLFVFPSNAQLHNNKVMRVVSDMLCDFY